MYASGGLGRRALVRVQNPPAEPAGRTRWPNPLAESDLSERQPDLMLLTHRDDRYDFRHPQPQDVLLLVEVEVEVEVADSSLDFDRSVKLPSYAAAGIPEVWIVNLETDRIES